MKIKSVRIQNFRCIEHSTIEFDDLTSFIGPNGAGKSTVLRALEWLFNRGKDDLTSFDIFGSGESNSRDVSVTVVFDQLTARDRVVLTERYAPSSATTFAVRREWGLATPDKMTGATLGFSRFNSVRALQDGQVGPLKDAYEALRVELDGEGVTIPKESTKPKILAALADWEGANPALLTEEFVSDSHMFGIAGQGELARVFKYVFVDADLRARDESEDSNKSVVNRILGHALDRSEADKALKALAAEVTAKHNEINETHLGPSLLSISEKLSATVAQFTTGRDVRLKPLGSDYAPPKAKVTLSIWDGSVETRTSSQGHGFQRALLIAALQVLAEYASSADKESTLFLAIEEPELFQHPNQARAFNSVLREIASQTATSAQVAFATHSIYFVDPTRFEEVRRVTKNVSDGFQISSTSRAEISAIVSPNQSSNWDISSTWSNVILKDLAEALFASGVVLCEGPDDAAVIVGASSHSTSLHVAGISVASAGGKSDLFLPHAVLTAFGIPVMVVFDNDSDMKTRSIARKKRKNGSQNELTPAELADIDRNVASDAVGLNKKLSSYLGISPVVDYPLGLLSKDVFAVDDTLETALMADWPEMLVNKDAIIAAGDGSRNVKHVATYQLAAETCAHPPKGQIAQIVAAALALV